MVMGYLLSMLWSMVNASIVSWVVSLMEPQERNTGNQISYTLKYKPEVTNLKDFRNMMGKYQPVIRACSVMPQTDTSAYEYQPEETVTKATYEEMVRAIQNEMKEDIGAEHVMCDGGACPVDFDSGDVAENDA